MSRLFPLAVSRAYRWANSQIFALRNTSESGVLAVPRSMIRVDIMARQPTIIGCTGQDERDISPVASPICKVSSLFIPLA